MTQPGGNAPGPVTIEAFSGAAPEVAWSLLKDCPAGLLAQLGDQLERLALTDLPRALDAGTRLIAAADDAFGTDPVHAPARARCRRAMGQALCYGNRFDEALGMLREAVEIARGVSDELEAARARHTMVHALARKGLLTEAIAEGEAAYLAFSAAGDRVMGARADVNVGVVARMMDDPARALLHFDRARAQFQDPMILGQIDSNRAEALLDLHRFRDAELAFETALAALRTAGARRAAAIVEGNLADLAGRQGRLGDALVRFEAARRELEHSGAPGDAARLHAEQAEVLLTLGLATDAAEAFAAALAELRKHQLSAEESRTAAGFARALMRAGRFAEAEDALSTAGKGFESLGNATGLGRVRLASAELAEADGRLVAAEELAGQAIQGAGKRPADGVAARLRLASVYLKTSRSSLAETEADTALRTAQDLGLPPLVADCLYMRARARAAVSGPTDAAYTDLRNAVRQVERLRGALSVDRFRTAFLGNRAQIYHDCASAALDRGNTGEAFEIVEQAKARSLLDTMERPPHAELSAPVSGDHDHERRLETELAVHLARLAALYSALDRADNPDAARLTAWRNELAQAEAAARSVEDRLGTLRARTIWTGSGVTLDHFRARLPAGTAAIEFFPDRGGLSAFVVSSQRVEVCRGFADLRAVTDALGAFSFQISRAMARGFPKGPVGSRMNADARRPLQELHRLLLLPLEERVPELLTPGLRIAIIPHGPLFAVPFAALERDGQPLCTRAQILTGPSASTLDRLSRQSNGHADNAGRQREVFVGISDQAAPHAGEEAAALSGRSPGSILLFGPQATIDATMAAARGAGLMHLATHARFVPSAPMASGVKLADGWLLPRQIAALELGAPSDPETAGRAGAVVVLSACETGRARVDPGDEQAGLVRAFLAAGASGLLMSLWPVHDQATQFTMQELYANFGSRTPADLVAATRIAIEHTRERYPHPAAWAPLVCVGGL